MATLKRTAVLLGVKVEIEFSPDELSTLVVALMVLGETKPLGLDQEESDLLELLQAAEQCF